MATFLAILLAAQAQAQAQAPQLAVQAPPARRAPACARGCLDPVETVTLADRIGDRGAMIAEFAFTARAVGTQRGMIFVNSETDYRARNNVTVVLTPAMARTLAGADGVDAARERLVGHDLVVRGVARRVRIDFTDDNGKPTGKYYYQVHILPAPGPSMTVR